MQKRNSSSKRKANSGKVDLAVAHPAEQAFGGDEPAQVAARDREVSGPADDGTFPIVGIGASAGGLSAFEKFFSGMPAEGDPDMAFVLVQHLAPDHESILAELIRRYTRMQVYEVVDGIVVKPNCAYIIPPNRDMALINGSLQLLEPSAPRGQRLPIDFFFRSLAQDQHEKAICIVLSGTGSDGTQGVRAVKGEGGMAMAQTPDSTEYEGMPRSAINTGLVDFQLPPAEMPMELIAYAGRAFGKASRIVPSSLPAGGGDLNKICILLRTRTGHDFTYYKPSTLIRRIERRMAVQQIETMHEFVSFLQRVPSEVDALFRDLLIGVTNFFRDPEAFRALEEQVIPRLFEGRDAGDVIRIWSVGCSTGEEAYSLAILLQERMGAIRQNCTVQVFATDIDSQAIATARAGLYPASIAADLSAERLARFFGAEAGGSMYRVHKGIRDMLVFSEQDLGKDPPFSRLDLISCRNLLIYMGETLHKKVIPLFHYALNPGGFLFIGKSETVGEFGDMFAVVDRSSKIYQRREELSVANRKTLGRFVQTITAPSGSIARTVERTRIIGKQDLRGLMEQALLQQLAPASALVNGQGDILYLHGRTGLFLEPPQGEPGVSNILAMAREGLRPDLTIALRKAVATNAIVLSAGLRVRTNGDFSRVNLTVRPMAANPAGDPKALLYLVLLEIVALRDEALEPAAPRPVEAANGAEDAVEVDARILELKKELRAKEDYLQAANEELATSNEELKSSNEEMQSVNEELQSANEELETSREELQSINEELATVNAELQTKVVDLSQVNNDMNNLLAGTGIGTVFVDLHLQIVRFTPAATRIINLIAADIGRPVGNITANLREYDTLVDDVQEVLDSLIPKELEAQTKSGAWYAMRIQPYRTLDNVIEGAVITFVDISERKMAQDALRLIEERYRNLMNYSKDAVFIEHQGALALVNPACLLLFKARSESELIGKPAYDLVHPDFRERLKVHLAGLLLSGDPASPIMVKILRLDGASVDVELIAAPFAFAGMKDIHFILRESHADRGN